MIRCHTCGNSTCYLERLTWVYHSVVTALRKESGLSESLSEQAAVGYAVACSGRVKLGINSAYFVVIWRSPLTTMDSQLSNLHVGLRLLENKCS